MVVPPSGPPPPTLPQGWKAHWNSEYKAWFYENIYTEESVWEMPTQPVYPARPRGPPGPPPGYQAATAAVEKTPADPGTLQTTMAAVSLSDKPQFDQQLAPQQYQNSAQQPYNPSPPQAQTYQQPQQLTSQSAYASTPPPGQIPSPQPTAEASRDYPPAPQYAQQTQQASYMAYPTQQPTYPQQPAYAQQPQYAQAQQPQYAQVPSAQQTPPQKAGFMGMLQNKVGNKVPGGAGTILGVGGGLLAGAVLEHEWDKHEDHKRRHHGGLGGLGGLMRGFGPQPVVENITIDDTTNNFVDDGCNSGTFNF